MRCRTRPSGDILSPVGGGRAFVAGLPQDAPADLDGADVNPGETITGSVAFQVPTGTPLKVAYARSSWCSGRGSDGDPASGGQTLDVAVMPPSSVAMNLVGRTVMTTRTSLSVTS